MPQSSDTAVSRIFAFLRHPLTLLFLGALCTYWLVPVLTHNRLLQEARIAEGRKIFEQAVLTDKQLIALRTELESFHKEASIDPKKFKVQQDELRKSMDELYAKFEEHSWYWCHSVEFEAEFLSLTTRARGHLTDLCKSYVASVVQSVNTLKPIWIYSVTQCTHAGQVSPDTLDRAHGKLEEIAAERGKTVESIVDVFREP